MLTKTIQGQSQWVDGVDGVAARRVRFVIELGVGVRGQTKTERGNLEKDSQLWKERVQETLLQRGCEG